MIIRPRLRHLQLRRRSCRQKATLMCESCSLHACARARVSAQMPHFYLTAVSVAHSVKTHASFTPQLHDSHPNADINMVLNISAMTPVTLSRSCCELCLQLLPQGLTQVLDLSNTTLSLSGLMMFGQFPAYVEPD